MSSATTASGDESYPSLSLNSEDYEIGETIGLFACYILGFGSSAIVYIATFRPLGKIVSIKMIDLDRFERNQIDELRKEIQVMSLCRHPNLLPILASFVDKTKLWIVTPFLSGGSCLDIMKEYFQLGLEEHAIATILKQALQGLAYLHKSGHIHRDVKAGNLLIEKQTGTVKLADFGVSSSLLEDGERQGIRKTFVGTPCWMAPETEGYDCKADIWSFGITALELALGSAPFSKYPPMKVIYMTLTNQPPSLDRSKTKHKYSRSFKEMIDSCLVKNPSKRPSAEALLKHPFFKLAKKNSFLAELLFNIPPVNQRNIAVSKLETSISDISFSSNEDLSYEEDKNKNPEDEAPKREVETGQSWDFRSETEETSEMVSDSKMLEETQVSETYSSYSHQLSLPVPLMSANAFCLKENRTEEPSVSNIASTISYPNQISEIKKGRFSILEVTSPAPSIKSEAQSNTILQPSSVIDKVDISLSTSSPESTIAKNEGQEGTSKSRFTKLAKDQIDTVTSADELVALIKTTLNLSSESDITLLQAALSKKNISIISAPEGELLGDGGNEEVRDLKVDESLVNSLKMVHHQLSLFLKNIEPQ